MNVGEYGISFNFNLNYDISGNTSLSLAITRPDATTITATAPNVTVGLVDLVTPLGTFTAKQYAIYVFANGDLTQAGTYTARLTYTDANKRLVSDKVTFTVNA